MTQQKDTDPEEYKRLHSERDAHVKRIQQLSEETSRLKAEATRYKKQKLFVIQPWTRNDVDLTLFLWQLHYTPHPPPRFICRSSVSCSTLQSQVQNLRDNLGKVVADRDSLKKQLEAKTLDVQEKVKTITQVKKLGRRYKTQYEELKVEHDKASVHDFILFYFILA